MADRTGDRKGRPYRRVPPMIPMADRTGDRVGAPLQAGTPNDTHDRPHGRPRRGTPTGGCPR